MSMQQGWQMNTIIMDDHVVEGSSFSGRHIQSKVSRFCASETSNRDTTVKYFYFVFKYNDFAICGDNSSHFMEIMIMIIDDVLIPVNRAYCLLLKKTQFKVL